MIQVRVRQDDGVHAVWRDGKVFPVPLPQLLEPLEQTAIEEHAGPGVFEQVFRPGHGLSGTEKREIRQRLNISDGPS